MVAIIDNTLGAVFIGFAIACTVYGMLISQAISYFRNYPGDKPIFKILVRSSLSTRRDHYSYSHIAFQVVVIL